MQHLEEGTIHAWLDGELPLEERAAVEAHVASCDECAAAVAEARGFIAASTRILTALDSVPGGVLPATSKGSSAKPAVHRRFVISRAWMAAAAVLVLSTVTVIAIRPGSDVAQLRVAATTQDRMDSSTSAAPAEQKPRAAEPSIANAPALAPAPMQSRNAAPADAPKSDAKDERLESRFEAKRQSASAQSSSGEPGGSTGATLRARAPEPAAPPAPMARISEQQAAPTVASALSKDAADKRADAVSAYDSMSARRSMASGHGVSISGRVTSDAGAPLQSASVVVEGTGVGTITRNDGSYSFTVPASRVKGASPSLVARLIGYKSATVPITPASDSITHDFTLESNPLSLSGVVITGAGTTSATEKLGAVATLDSAATDSAAPRMLSHKKLVVDSDTVVTTIYSVRGVSVSLIDHSRVRDDAGNLKVRGAVSEMPAKARAAAAAVNSISWSDSTGHTRTLRGPLTPDQLEQLKRTLFGATP